jgi:hypothetical protein
MITHFAIKAFKSIMEASLDLGRVNVFIGANGSGKSNLLEAIGVLGAAASGIVDDESLLRRGVRPGLPALYKSSFSGTGTRPSIRIEVSSDSGARYAVELNNPIRDPQPAWEFKNELLEEGKRRIAGRSPASSTSLSLDPQRGYIALKAVELEPSSPASDLLSIMQRYCIYTPTTNSLRGLDHDRQQREPVGLSGGRLPEAVSELIRNQRNSPFIKSVCSKALALIDWANTYGSMSANGGIPLSPSAATSQQVLYFKDKYMAQGRDLLTGYDASEGALYVLFAAVIAAHPLAPSFLAVDNIDHGLNPRLARALIESLCSWCMNSENTAKQLVLTTHNPLALDGLPLNNPEIRLFAVERSRKGYTVISRVTLPSLEELQRDGELWTVSRLWVMGHLGGVPSV